MAAGIAAAAAADDPQKSEPPPKPDRGTTSQLDCIDQKSEYTRTGHTIFYVQTFENKCEARMKCAVFSSVLQAKGLSHGQGTVVLGPKSAGASAKKSYAMKVEGTGGFGTSERECRVL
jgi:hypothetical protein